MFIVTYGHRKFDRPGRVFRDSLLGECDDCLHAVVGPLETDSHEAVITDVIIVNTLLFTETRAFCLNIYRFPY